MQPLLDPTDVERLARERGLTMRAVCDAAGIAQSTFSRWRGGQTQPTLDVYRRLVAVVSGHAANDADGDGGGDKHAPVSEQNKRGPRRADAAR